MSKIMVIGYGELGRTLVRMLSLNNYPPIESVHILTKKEYYMIDTEVMDCRSIASMIGSHTKILYHTYDLRMSSSISNVVDVVRPDVIVICPDEENITNDVSVPTEFIISLPKVYNILTGIALCMNKQYRPVIINCELPEITNYILYSELKMNILGAGGVEAALIRMSEDMQDISGSERIPKLSFAGVGSLIEKMNYNSMTLEALDEGRGCWYRLSNCYNNSRLLANLTDNISGRVLITSAQCAKIIGAVLSGIPYESHIPGLNGFPGTIKATVSNDQVEIHEYATAKYAEIYDSCLRGFESMDIDVSNGIEFTEKFIESIEEDTGVTFSDRTQSIYGMMKMSKEVFKALDRKGE